MKSEISTRPTGPELLGGKLEVDVHVRENRQAQRVGRQIASRRIRHWPVDGFAQPRGIGLRQRKFTRCRRLLRLAVNGQRAIELIVGGMAGDVSKSNLVAIDRSRLSSA